MEGARVTGSSELAIETEGLQKHFGETKAVDGVDLAVKRGMVYGVLGPNGAGKTTVIRMLATLLRPTGGTARVFGHDIVKNADAVRGCVSLTGQFASVDEELTGRENLILLGRLLGFSTRDARSRADDLLGAFGIDHAADRLAKTFSGGMRRRLDIAASLIVNPELIFLDEPTTGLDPRSRNQVWDIVRALVAGGTTVLLTTQYLDEADQLAERIAVIEHGKVIAEGTSGDLKRSVGSGTIHVTIDDAARSQDARATLARVVGSGDATSVEVGSDPTRLVVRTDDTDRAGQALSELSRAGIAVADFSLGQPSLDEVFLALTGRPAEAPASEEVPA